MSTQTLTSLPEFQNQIQNRKFLLDEPWKVTLIPAGAPVGEDPHTAKSLPWRVGDVMRLKDDSPKGMMEYIATHSTGWWREMAERALRDTEKAESMARDAGWQHGQYWALEVDAEAKQKLLEAEEARRAREEAERAKALAEKEAFIQRQMELLEKAGKAPRCEYTYTDGRGCKAPQVTGERWCHGHAKMMSYRPEKLDILPMEDEQAVMVNLYRVTQSLLAGRISEKTAGLTLWSVAIAAPCMKRVKSVGRGPTRKKKRANRVIARDRNVIARDRKGKPKTFETQRNGGGRGNNRLPRINADERGSGKQQLARTETTEPQRTRRTLRRTRRELTRKNTNESGSHAGVTNDKSFVSGVSLGSTPAIAEIARDRNVTSTPAKPKPGLLGAPVARDRENKTANDKGHPLDSLRPLRAGYGRQREMGRE